MEGDYAWYASRAGLTKINRQTNESFTFTPSNSDIPNNFIRDMLLGVNGEIWIVGESKLGKFVDDTYFPVNPDLVGVGDVTFYPTGMELGSNGRPIIGAYYYDGTQTTHYILSVQGDNSVTEYLDNEGNLISASKFLIDANEVIWTFNQGYFSKVDNGIVTHYDESNSPLGDDSYYNFLLEAPDGRILVVEEEGGNNSGDPKLYKGFLFDGNNWETIDLTNLGLPTGANFFLMNVFYDFEDILWFSFSNGDIIKFDGIDLEILDWPLTFPDVYNNSRQLLNISEDGHWWVHQYNYNSNRLHEITSNSVVHHFSSNADLASSIVEDIFVGEDGKVYLLNHDGLSIFDGINWDNLTAEMTQPRLYYNQVKVAPDGTVWACGRQDIAPYASFSKLSNGVWEHIDFGPIGAFNYDNAYEFDFDSQGNLWAVTDKGLRKYDGNEWTVFDENNSNFPGSPIGITIREDDEIYINGYYGFYHFDGANFNEIPLSGSFIFWVFEDTESNLWVKYNDGIAIYDGNSMVDITSSIVPDQGGIFEMTEDLNGNFWFATCEGLWKYDEVNWTNFTTGFPSGCLQSIAVDSFNNIWLATGQHGAAVFNENGINNPGSNAGACIEGTVYLDFNENGTQEPTEFKLSGQKVQLLPENTVRFTSALGNYKFPVADNTNAIVEILPDNNDWLLTSDSASYTVTTENICVENLDFGVASTQIGVTGSIDITAGLPRCFLSSAFWGTVKNTGYIPLSGSYSLTVDGAIEVLEVTPQPTEIDGNIYTWDLEMLNPLQIQNFQLELQYPGVDAIGDILTFSAQLRDEFNNLLDEKTEQQVILCSYDPNDKSGKSVGESIGNYSLLDDALDYLIRFENSGNDTAFRVVIRDTLSQFLDLNSFKIIGSSHPVEVSIQNRVVEFVFQPILLPQSDIDPVGSQGYVKFNIRPVANLPDNQLISNTAYIYFDFNPAIVTNTTENILVEELPFIATGEEDALKQNCDLKWSPNPFQISTNLTVPDQFLNGEFTLFNVVGKPVFSTKVNNNILQLQRNNLAADIYFYQLRKGNASCGGKLVIR